MDKPPKEENVTTRLEPDNNGQNDVNNLSQDEQKIASLHKDNMTNHLSSVFMMSVLISLIFGWVAGFFSLYNKYTLILAIFFMVIGAFIGFYFDRRINKEVDE